MYVFTEKKCHCHNSSIDQDKGSQFEEYKTFLYNG